MGYEGKGRRRHLILQVQSNKNEIKNPHLSSILYPHFAFLWQKAQEKERPFNKKQPPMSFVLDSRVALLVYLKLR
jgi:hypothetical protein